jgi:hypothetical protein
MTVQGKLTDSTGAPLPAGPKTFEFRIFDAQSGGNEVWPGGPWEVQSVSTDEDGLWTATIGTQFALTSIVFAFPSRWLQIKVDDGQTMTTLPRTQLVTSPYAHRVQTLDGATGGTILGGLDMPYTGSTLDNLQTGLRWWQTPNFESAFGMIVFYGLHFQGSYDGLNSQFGVRAPTSDGSLGPIVFSVSPSGDVYCDSVRPNFIKCSGGANLGAFAQTDGHMYVDQDLYAENLVAWSNANIHGYLCADNVACPSDARLKTKIETLENALESVSQLRGVSYEWRRDEFPDRNFPDDGQVGLVAQEVRQVVPQAVIEDEDGYLAVDYARLVPLLIEGMKEQQKRIEKLEETIRRMQP